VKKTIVLALIILSSVLSGISYGYNFKDADEANNTKVRNIQYRNDRRNAESTRLRLAEERRKCAIKRQKAKELRKKKVQRVTICHKTSSAKNPYVTITVSKKALFSAHQNHGDRLGACN